jgi:hypothetical protein
MHNIFSIFFLEIPLQIFFDELNEQEDHLDKIRTLL